ncbi:cob(I)yrinic acid a,c-diamide adenosyltransferase [Coralloluteibacterium stylophorae]|uniref:Corrinoid adenosyltransferase n=1 Tax=Coralloluteibacterium stylophorae TaxID=1776034 RepID=A0A8J7VRS0_9GAMM|nr:cob(I)yrinic acid a,c-diamide adenosyltransferase [Coralloluteibacterium stylophorae]
MGHRLSRIVTRTGDDGSTGLGDGSRVPKDGARVEAIGAVDEANSALGLVAAAATDADLRALVLDLQHALFDLGAELAVPGHAVLGAGDVDWIEARLEALNADLPPLKEFVLPGGGTAAAHCHLARTLARRAERALVALARAETVRADARRFLNRVSDLLFVLARALARAEGCGEVLWDPARRSGRRR